jgi:hypothetical protein
LKPYRPIGIVIVCTKLLDLLLWLALGSLQSVTQHYMASVSQGESRCSSDFIPLYIEGSYASQSFSSADTEEDQLSGSSDEEQIGIATAPRHPIPELQGPFEESITESLPGTNKGWTVDLDAQSRRRDLLEGSQYERLCGRKWRQRTGERLALPCASAGRF